MFIWYRLRLLYFNISYKFTQSIKRNVKSSFLIPRNSPYRKLAAIRSKKRQFRGISKDRILIKLQKRFDLTEKQAAQYYQQFAHQGI